jgi:peptidoglycan/xylan/chitin deacetylase (PgdA/CDA1 family)
VLPLVLCYHKVERRRELGVTRISPRRFARQIERLSRSGYRTIALTELLACANGTRAPGDHEIVITFDDAYRGLRDHAFPVLEAHGFTAVCSAITAFAGRLNRWDVAYGGRRFAHLTWRDMRRWQTRGITFVPHTVTHPRLTWCDDATAYRELAQSRLDLMHALDCDASVISYPFGAAGQRERLLAQQAGYVAGLTLATPWTGDSFSIPRLPVYLWSPPAPGVGALASFEWRVAAVANRCAVGTTAWQRLTRLASDVRRSISRPREATWDAVSGRARSCAPTCASPAERD